MASQARIGNPFPGGPWRLRRSQPWCFGFRSGPMSKWGGVCADEGNQQKVPSNEQEGECHGLGFRGSDAHRRAAR